jgi:NADH dehydrogenase
VLFGGADILINNMAWILRHVPAFGLFGTGDYRLQPIHVRDLADLAVAKAVARSDLVIDAVGPETYTYRELAEELARIIGVRRPILTIPPQVGYLIGWLIGKAVGDIVITRDEIQGLMQGLLATDSEPAGHTRLSRWAREHAHTLGRHYATELGRRRNRRVAYAEAR